MQTEIIKENEIKRTNTINFSDRGIELIERIIKLNKEVSLLFSDTGDSLQIIIRTDTVESKYTFGEKDLLFTKQFNNINLGAMFSVEERIISISNGITENGVDVIEIVTPSNKTLLEVKADTPTYSSMIDIAPEAWEYMGRADLNSSSLYIYTSWNIYTRGTALTFMRGEEVEIYQSTSLSEKKVFGLFISKPDAEVTVKIQAILEIL